jgi:hypothetical protein
LTPVRISQHAFTHIPKIVGALRKQLIAQTRQPLGMGLHGVLPTEGGAFPLGNCRGGDLDEVGILKQLGVGGENRRFRLLSMAMKLSTQGFELPGRLVYGIIEQPPLLIGRAPSSFTWISTWRTWYTSPTASPDDAATPVISLGSASFLGAGAAIGAIVIVAGAETGTQPSSPSPSAIIGVSLFTASRASGPLAKSTTLSPRAVSSAIKDVTLRAFAERSPSCSLISLLNAFAVLLKTAAGCAWRPFGFGK